MVILRKYFKSEGILQGMSPLQPITSCLALATIADIVGLHLDMMLAV